MSQQINLLLPELRPRFDWLALPVVAAAAGVALVAFLLFAEYQSLRNDRLKGQEADVNGQMLNLQQQVQTLQQTLSARQPSATLPQEIADMKAGVDQRREVLDFVSRAGVSGNSAYSGVLDGFSRQAGEGVWLTGFGLSGQDIEIRGRLLDASLLPAYIERLNADAAFQGRRFSALEMKGVVPVAPTATAQTPGNANTPPVASPGRPYTEFTLRSGAATIGERTQ